MNFETIKKNYEKHLWNKTLVKIAVQKGLITPEQYREITGEDYK